MEPYIGKLGNRGHYNIQSSTLHPPLHSKLEHMLFPTDGVKNGKYKTLQGPGLKIHEQN